MSLANFILDVRSGNISVVEYTQKILKEAKEKNLSYSHFNVIAKQEALQQAEQLDKEIKEGKTQRKLLGVPVSVKDCICVKGVESRSGSRILSGYKPTFDATVISRARDQGAIVVGKTAQDEFGFGTFSVNTGIGFPIPKNPLDQERSCGGSSGGAAGWTVLTEHAHVAIGESTGGSIACPASFCGCVGITPTYGRVSRYGLMDYASSLDKIGSMGKTVEDASLLLEVIAGADEKDSTSLPQLVPPYSKNLGKEVKGLKVGVLMDFFEKSEPGVAKTVLNALGKFDATGINREETSLPLNSKYAIEDYYLIATAEASTNLAKYCGMRYGQHEDLKGTFDEYFTGVRSKHFGEEAKRRILLGTFGRMSGFRDAYYLKAMKVRTLLIKEFKKLFSKFDVLVNPSMPIVAPRFEEIEKLSPMQNYAMDLCTVPANLAGLPHVSIPVGKSKGMPVGAMLIADHLQEEKMLQLAAAWESALK